DLGYIDGQNIMIEQRYAEGNANRMPELAADLVKLAPDLIVAVADQAATVARDATTTTPVVFLGVGDPVASGLVQSLARPGGSMTGVVYVAPGVSTKRLELLKETAPGIARVAVITG